MKRLFLAILFALSIKSFSQDLPTEPAAGFAFPLGSKFTIKLVEKDSSKFDLSIVDYEPYQQIVDTYETDSLFDEKGVEGTIEFYFCLGTHGYSELQKEENMNVLLIFKNRTKYNLSYKSDIQLEENGEFEETSNIGALSGVKGTEMWPYMIYQIGLHDFEIYIL